MIARNAGWCIQGLNEIFLYGFIVQMKTNMVLDYSVCDPVLIINYIKQAISVDLVSAE